MNTPKSKPPAERSQLKNVALFAEEDDDKVSLTISLDLIVLPPNQPRRYFAPLAMGSLVESVKKDGILQPILVRPLGEQYELVAGERRYQAAKKVGLTEIPAISREMTDVDARQYALTENLQREDLNPVEETEGILHLLALKLNTTTEEVIKTLTKIAHAQRKENADNVVRNPEEQIIIEVFQGIGRLNAESFRTHRLPLLNLPQEILEVLRSGILEYTKAKAISRIKDEEQRKALLLKVIDNNLSLNQIKEEIANLKTEPDLASPKVKIQIITQRLNQAKLWEKDKKKWKKVEGLLERIEKILFQTDLSTDDTDEEKIEGISKKTLAPIFEDVPQENPEGDDNKAEQPSLLDLDKNTMEPENDSV